MLTHGAGGSHAAWFQQVPALAAAGYRVVTWDSRGFGNSTFASGVHGADAAVADMVAVLDATGIECGAPRGPVDGWLVGRRRSRSAHPTRVRSLTLSNTVGGLWTDALHHHFRDWVASQPRDFVGARGASRARAVVRRTDPARAFLYQQLNTFHTPPVMEVGAALVDDRVSPAALDAAGVPLLLITGSDDALVPAPSSSSKASSASLEHARSRFPAPVTPRTSSGPTNTTPRSWSSSKACGDRHPSGTSTVFRRDGFVVVDDLMPADELDRYEPLVTAAVAHRARAQTTRASHARSLYEQSFRQCMNLWEDFPEVAPLTFHPTARPSRRRSCSGSTRVRLWHDQALYKEAGGRETDPHQDQPYWPITETDTITAWVPFAGRRSRTARWATCRARISSASASSSNIFQAEDAGGPWTSPRSRLSSPCSSARQRGAVFHGGLTVHMAKPNATTQTARCTR